MHPTDNIVAEKKIFRRILRLMGNRFEISVVASTLEEVVAEQYIDEAIAEIRRIEALLTTFNDSSVTSKINESAGLQPVKVDTEVFSLVERSLRISSLTQGAFDISYGSADKRWWNLDKNLQSVPDPATARENVRLINYRNIILDHQQQTIFLKEKGMRIGFGAIGKGYAAERARALLISKGVESGVVNAAGDLTTWGTQPDGNPWTIGIAMPDAPEWPFSYLNISGLAVATSGNYEKFVVVDGKKYAHTIDPKTGMPVEGIKSVTIICSNAEIADALATPVMIMGIDAGLNMINQMKHIGCIIIDEANQLYTSDNVNLN